MPTLKQNEFGAVPNNTTITPANSGGGGNLAFDAVTLTGTASAKGDTAAPSHPHGPGVLRVNTPATSDVARVGWTGLNDTSAAIRFGFRYNTLPGTTTFAFRATDTSGATICTLQIGPTNKIGILDASGTGVAVFQFANALVTGQDYTAYIYFAPGTTTSNGTVRVQYCLGDSPTPVETAYTANGTANMGTVNIGEVRYIKVTGAGKFDGWAQDAAYLGGASGFLNPYTAATSVPAAASQRAVKLPTVTGTYTAPSTGPARSVRAMKPPSITATAAPSFVVTPEPDNEPPRVRLDINSSSGVVYVTRTGPDGVPVPVRGGDPAATVGGQAVLYDYDAPYNVPVVYTAGSVTAAAVTLTSDQSWLIHPGVPSLSQPITPIGGVPDESFASSAGVHQVVGRRHPIVVTDGRRKGAVFSMAVLTDTAAADDGMDALLYDTSPLLLQVVDPNAPDTRMYRWVSVGDVSRGRPGVFGDPVRVWSFDCIDVDRPAGQVQAQRTYADLLTEAATYADLLALYDTYRDVLVGTS